MITCYLSYFVGPGMLEEFAQRWTQLIQNMEATTLDISYPIALPTIRVPSISASQVSVLRDVGIAFL
jgi:hypothetical protein